MNAHRISGFPSGEHDEIREAWLAIGVWRDGIAVTAPARTIVDVAHDLQPDQLVITVRQALARGLLTRRQLEEEADRQHRRPIIERALAAPQKRCRPNRGRARANAQASCIRILHSMERGGVPFAKLPTYARSVGYDGWVEAAPGQRSPQNAEQAQLASGYAA